ncbi:HNH endonuclease [Leucobacter aridicollis]|uniref:HNH endonuclease n=1 Tax=Leucobacter aridicollis TaxID=283878 RepID=UPI00351D46BE
MTERGIDSAQQPTPSPDAPSCGYGGGVQSRRKYPKTRSAATSARYAKRRKNRLARVDNDLTDDQWQTLLEAWGCCAYCQGDGAALQRDCVQPVSRGGRYTLGNVVPACASCNASKHNSEVTSWLRRKKLDERAFLLRHATILQQLLPDPEPDGRQLAEPEASALDTPPVALHDDVPPHPEHHA